MPSRSSRSRREYSRPCLINTKVGQLCRRRPPHERQPAAPAAAPEAASGLVLPERQDRPCRGASSQAGREWWGRGRGRRRRPGEHAAAEAGEVYVERRRRRRWWWRRRRRKRRRRSSRRGRSAGEHAAAEAGEVYVERVGEMRAGWLAGRFGRSNGSRGTPSMLSSR